MALRLQGYASAVEKKREKGRGWRTGEQAPLFVLKKTQKLKAELISGFWGWKLRKVVCWSLIWELQLSPNANMHPNTVLVALSIMHQAVESSNCLNFFAAADSSDTTLDAKLSIDASNITGGYIRSMHGVSQGPVQEIDWLRNIPRPNKERKDWTAGFNRTAVPAVRTHGMGCVDMDRLWNPYPK
jgi:hypothetical protein